MPLARALRGAYDLLLRGWNAVRRSAAGIPGGGEAVWPGLRNDLFVAHESIYRFAGRWAPGCRVLDAACGTGYGSSMLLDSGAIEVLGIDRDPRRIAFAARRFRAARLSYQVQDCEALDLPGGSFDLVVCSNTLEHLERPERFLRAARELLREDGLLLVAVPPIFSAADLQAHARNAHHRSNLTVRQWIELFLEQGWRACCFGHHCRRPLDFSSPSKSTVDWVDFEFPELPVDEAVESATISAIFVLRAGDVALERGSVGGGELPEASCSGRMDPR